ncbi:type IX secretion system protein PorQ [Rubrivirga sp. IMCC43871]|uniref:type IX secretion system protein PorQ n=1 Tax=Rubrivirga sp. IMCC43871 TaxID=3391575 RepID=UPI0039902A70
MRPVLLAAALVFGCAASAQPRTQTAYDLVRLDVSARSAALGGPAALAGDPAAAFANPALLTPTASGALALGYTNLVADVNAGSAAYARDVGLFGGLTVLGAVRYLSFGDFERRDEIGGDATGTFSANEAAVTLASSREVLPRIRVGLAAHALFASLDDAGGSALAADAGLSYTVEEQGLRVGASVHHVGAVLSSLGATDDRLPLDVRLTVAKRLRYVPLTVSVAGVDLHHFEGAASDSSFANRALDHLALGGELQLGQTFTVRAGYNGRRGADFRSGGRLDLAGVSVGAGVSLRRVSVDYAFQNWGDFGGTHQFGIRTRL